MSEGGMNARHDSDFQRAVPSELSESDLARCVAIVGAGGAVSAKNAAGGLARASSLVVVRRDGDIVAVGAVKRALPSYVAVQGVCHVRARDTPVR